MLIALILLFGFQTITAGIFPQAKQIQATKVAECAYQPPTYARLSASATIAKDVDYVEFDTDSGAPLTCTLPASPDALERHELWLGAQPGPLPSSSVTVNPNGNPVTLAPGLGSLVLDEANEGLVLVFVKPTPTGAGYWRASRL